MKTYLFFWVGAVSMLLFPACIPKVNTLVYQSDGDSFTFPEAGKIAHSTGVCFSGGGTRAYACAAGQMKALDSLGLWPKVGYVSSVSGGTWASSVFTYYQASENGPRNDQELLGTPKGAQNLTMEYLCEEIPPQQMIYAPTQSFVKEMFAILEKEFPYDKTGEYTEDLWINTISQLYLRPYGIEGDKYFTQNQASMEAVIKRAKALNLTPEDFQLVHSAEGDAPRPYLVINSSILGPTAGIPLAEPESLAVFNYTPLGVGSAKYHPVNGDGGYTIGGGFIEPFAMGGSAPISGIKTNSNGETYAEVRVKEEDRFTLDDATGTSSAAFAAIEAGADFETYLKEVIPPGLERDVVEFILGVVGQGFLVPEEPYWAVSDQAEGAAPEISFGDGGSLDNFGVISLLQRKVDQIVVFVNTDVPIDTTFVPGDATPTATTISYDFYTLFGDYSYENHLQNQVFTKGDFENVFNQFKACIRKGEPVTAKVTTKTQANQWWGIPEGQEVEILWFYNEKSPQWDSMLDTAIQTDINIGECGPFANFPQYTTGHAAGDLFIQLTPAMTKLLYEYQFYSVYHNKDIASFFSK